MTAARQSEAIPKAVPARNIDLSVGEAKDTSEVLSELVPLLDFDDIFTPELAAKVVVPRLGIAAGPANGLVGQGYTGKTIVALSMGLAIASGKMLWGVFSVARGRWLHLDHEQGRRHTKSRLVRLINGMQIDREELRDRIGVSVYPRLNLTHANAEDLYARLFEGFDFVTMDALRGLTPGVDENSVEVRDHIDRLGRASEKTGCAVLLVHHAGKTPMQGTRPRKEMARGSSGVFDALQSMFVLTGEKGEPVHVSHEKDRELGQAVDDFGLRIVDVTGEDGDPKWGLRVEHLEAEQLASSDRGDRQAASQHRALSQRVLAIVATEPGIAGVDGLLPRLKARKQAISLAVRELIALGAIHNAGSAARPRLYIGEAP